MDKVWMGAELRRIRTLAGIPLEEAAARIGVSRPTLSSWELGLKVPSPEKLARAAVVYSMEPDELAAHVDSPLAPRMVRPVKEWYAALRANGRHGDAAANGHTDSGNSTIQRPKQGRGRTTPGFWHAQALGV